MAIQWNRVTWYSKVLAIIVFLATFAIGFHLGVLSERARSAIPVQQPSGDEGGAPVVGAGEHCGGFIRNAPVCEAGYRCQLKVNSPDTGGTCVKE